MDDDSDTVADRTADREQLNDRLLNILEQTAAKGEFDHFQTAEWLLTNLHARGATRTREAWPHMRPADVARWQAARSVMFADAMARLETCDS